MRQHLSKILCWRPGTYLTDSSSYLGWLVLRAVAQVTSVIILARVLGADGYGQFITVLAVASFFPPFVTLGAGGVLLRDGAKFPQNIDQLFYRCIALWRLNLIFVVPVAVSIVWWFLPPPSLPLLAVFIFVGSEILSSSLSELVSRAEQARHCPRNYGLIIAGLPAVRLLSLALCLLILDPTAVTWMLVYGFVSVVYSMALWRWAVHRYHLKNTTGSKQSFVLLSKGLPFFSGVLSSRLQAEFNKPLLARVGYAESAYFGLAQRTLDLINLPLVALQEALWPKVCSSENPKQHLILFGIVLLLFSGFSVVAVLIIAHYLPALLGSEYKSMAHLLVLLAGMPMIQLLRNMFYMAIMLTKGAQIVTLIHIVTTAIVVVSSIVLISEIGLIGAVYVAYGGELLMILFIGIYFLRNKDCWVSSGHISR